MLCAFSTIENKILKKAKQMYSVKECIHGSKTVFKKQEIISKMLNMVTSGE
jgi:urease gamma subunit